jgi:LacI family transcriptional regulator
MKTTVHAGGVPAAGERPTLKTIAFMTGLGVTTVSRALKDAPDISQETKERVRLVASQIGYYPNRAGVRLRTGKTNVISLILNLEEELMGLTSSIVFGISEVLATTNYHLIVTPFARNTDPMLPVRYILDTGSADGVILSETEPDDPRVRLLMERNLPFATHGRTNMGIVHPYHDFDNEAFAYNAVRELVELGRRRLSILLPNPRFTFYYHTRQGFLRGIKEFGAEEVPFDSVRLSNRMQEIHVAALELMTGPHRPDGIITGSSAGGVAVASAIDRAGLKLGEDVDLVSKQPADLMRFIRPQIIAMSEDFRLAGRELAKAVLARIDGVPADSLRSICLPDGRLSYPY